jgi:hypothetical protein
MTSCRLNNARLVPAEEAIATNHSSFLILHSHAEGKPTNAASSAKE